MRKPRTKAERLLVDFARWHHTGSLRAEATRYLRRQGIRVWDPRPRRQR